MTPPHEPFDAENGVSRIGHRLPFRHGTHEAFPVLGKCDHGGCGAVAFRVRDDNRFAPFHDGDTGVGRSQIDSDYFSHIKSPLS